MSKASRRRARRDKALAMAAAAQERERAQQAAPPEKSESQSQSPGERGAGKEASGLSSGIENILVRQSLNRRWPVTEREKQIAVLATTKNMVHQDGRVVNGAVRNLALMESQNQRDEQPEPGVNVNVNTQVNTLDMTALRQELIGRPDILEQHRQAALETDSQGAVESTPQVDAAVPEEISTESELTRQ